MSGTTKRFLAIAAASLTAIACADLLGTNGADPLVLSPAFQTVPVGFSANTNSFDPSGDAGAAFFPGSLVSGSSASFDGSSSGSGGGDKGRGSNSGRRGGEGERRGGDDHGDRHDGFGEGGIRGLLMGGGLGPNFIGKIAFGPGRGRGPFGLFDLPESCTFSDATGRVTCPEFTRHDLTVNVSFAFKDVNGVAQAKFDTGTTNSVNVQTSVNGTKTRDDDDDDDNITSTVSHSSDFTIGGLATASIQRTVEGTAEAHEQTSGTRDGIAFTAVRDAKDEVTGLVIPLKEGRPTIPSAGTIVREMTVTITKAGSDPVTKSRREEISFDGSNMIKVVITQDGVTKTCTMTLPGRNLSCE
jgi:hypothetical protein